MYAAVRQTFKELGRLNGALYLGARFLDKTSRGRCRFVRYHIVAQAVPDTPLLARAAGAAQVRPAYPQDAETFAFPRPAHVIARRFEQGHQCLMCVSKERLAGFLWLARGHYDEDEVRCRFVLAQPEQMAWDFDVWVDPSFRLGRTFARLWDSANQTLTQQGVRWSLSRISTFNAQSLLSHARFGTVCLHTLNFLCVGKLQLSLMTCAPFVHLGWRDGDAPSVVLTPPQQA